MDKIKIVKRNKYAYIPEKSTLNAVGWDIRACFYEEALITYEKGKKEIPFKDFLENFSLTLEPFKPQGLSTGLSLELPNHIEMAIKSRSGLFIKNAILAEGTIDPDYRGEVKIMLINLGQQPFVVKHGERIAQALFRSVYNNPDLFLECQDLKDLSDTLRGDGGFGSTGVK